LFLGTEKDGRLGILENIQDQDLRTIAVLTTLRERLIKIGTKEVRHA